MKVMPPSYHRILARLETKEARLLRRPAFSPLSAPVERLREKIPNTLRASLEFAFEKAFSLLFSPEGERFLEHTFSKKKLDAQAGLWQAPLSPAQARKALRDMERTAALTRPLETAAAGVEGVALGLLGVGLPDIPVLLAWLLRSLYQDAARYGFSPDSDGERVYLLLLLQGALSGGEERRALSLQADRLGRALDHGWACEVSLPAQLRKSAALLSDRLLVVKFIQGLPLVGAAGGLSNLSISAAVSEYGGMKYKKRFLEKKVRGI